MKNLILIFPSLLNAVVFAQSHFPDLSSKGTIKQKVGFTTIEIIYERPAARGRKVFGELVPFDKLWRTGAANCTKIRFSRPVVIGGKTVSGGSYSIFTIPGSKQWTVILNSDTTLYGTINYDRKKDVVRFEVSPETSKRFYESFTIDIDVVPDNASIYFSWENIQIHFPVDTQTDKITTDFVEQTLLTFKSRDSDEYAAAAEYYFFQGKHFDRALALIDKAIELKKEPWYYRLKIDILEGQKHFPDAIRVCNQAIEMIRGRSDLNEFLKKDLIEEYEARIKKLRSIK